MEIVIDRQSFYFCYWSNSDADAFRWSNANTDTHPHTSNLNQATAWNNGIVLTSNNETIFEYIPGSNTLTSLFSGIAFISGLAPGINPTTDVACAIWEDMYGVFQIDTSKDKFSVIAGQLNGGTDVDGDALNTAKFKIDSYTSLWNGGNGIFYVYEEGQSLVRWIQNGIVGTYPTLSNNFGISLYLPISNMCVHVEGFFVYLYS
jgi:hypothetical protein